MSRSHYEYNNQTHVVNSNDIKIIFRKLFTAVSIYYKYTHIFSIKQSLTKNIIIYIIYIIIGVN